MFRHILIYIKNILIKNSPLLLGVISIFYFSFHMLHGNRGILSYMKLKKEYSKLVFELDELKLQKAKLENRISLLKNTIDLDLLEELAEKNLGLVYKDDIVIIRK